METSIWKEDGKLPMPNYTFEDTETGEWTDFSENINIESSFINNNQLQNLELLFWHSI